MYTSNVCPNEGVKKNDNNNNKCNCQCLTNNSRLCHWNNNSCLCHHHSSNNCKKLVFQHPFTVSVSGQTGSGKTYFVKMLMRHCKIKVSLPPERDIILWLYDIIKFTVYPHVEFIMGISLDLEQVPERETKTVNISHREDAPSSQPHRVPSTDQLSTFSEQTEASISSKYASSSQTHHKSPFSNQLRTSSEKTEASISHSVMTVAFLLKTCTTYRDM